MPPPTIVLGKVSDAFSEMQSVRFDSDIAPLGCLEAGGTLQLLQSDAALADEDLLVCAARYTRELKRLGAKPPAAALVIGAPERHDSAFGFGASCEAATLQAGLNLELPLASVVAPSQVAPLPPMPGQRRQRTFVHRCTSVTVLFREAGYAGTEYTESMRATGFAEDASTAPGEGSRCEDSPPSLVIQQDGSRSTHGGQLADITAGILRRLMSRMPPPQVVTPPLHVASRARSSMDRTAARASAHSKLTEGGEVSEDGEDPVPLALLGALVFPGCVSEFIIFEPRYRLLFGQALQARALGLEARFAVGCSTSEGLATLTTIDDHESWPDGRLRVRVRGERRFTYSSYQVRPASFGLWCAHPQRYLDDSGGGGGDGGGGGSGSDGDGGEGNRFEDEAGLAPDLIEQLREAASRNGWSLDALDGTVGEMPPVNSTEQLSWWFTHLLPAPPEVKRRWFMTTSTSARLRNIDEWMRATL